MVEPRFTHYDLKLIEPPFDSSLIDLIIDLNHLRKKRFGGDGAYDTVDCRQFIYDLGGKQIIPPKRTAREQKKNPIPALKERDEAIRKIKELGEKGRAEWKK